MCAILLCLLIYWTILVIDDGALYFDEKQVDAREYRGPLSTTSSVIRGITKFAAVASGKLDVSQYVHRRNY